MCILFVTNKCNRNLFGFPFVFQKERVQTLFDCFWTNTISASAKILLKAWKTFCFIQCVFVFCALVWAVYQRKYQFQRGREQIKTSFQLTASVQVWSAIFASITHFCWIKNSIFVRSRIFGIFRMFKFYKLVFCFIFNAHLMLLLVHNRTVIPITCW